MKINKKTGPKVFRRKKWPGGRPRPHDSAAMAVVLPPRQFRAITTMTRGLRFACTDIAVIMGENSFFKTAEEHMQEVLIRFTSTPLLPPPSALPFPQLCVASSHLQMRWYSYSHFLLACETSRTLQEFCAAGIPALQRGMKIDLERMVSGVDLRTAAADMLQSGDPFAASLVADVRGNVPAEMEISLEFADLVLNARSNEGAALAEPERSRDSRPSAACVKFGARASKFDAASKQGILRENSDLTTAGVEQTAAHARRLETNVLLVQDFDSAPNIRRPSLGNFRRIPAARLRILGAVDGYDANGRVVETKRRARTRRYMPKSEKIQMEMYMWLRELATQTPADFCTHVENVGDDQFVSQYAHTPRLREKVKRALRHFLVDLADRVAFPHQLKSFATQYSKKRAVPP
jgi:hypothetical protein